MSFTRTGDGRNRRDGPAAVAGEEALMQEGLRCFGLVEKARAASCRSMYYGINVTRASEPLDQLDAFLLYSRLRRMGLDANLAVFVAGRYNQLNGRPAGELEAAEISKMQYLGAAARALGVPVRLLRTKDLWQEADYWSEAYWRRSECGIISERRGAPFSQIASGFEREILDAMPPGFLEDLGPIDAPALYRLFEVAEAGWLAANLGVDCKVGPASEQEYDAFISRFMGVIQLRQPLDFRSCAAMPKPVTPYIGKEGEDRIFIEDSKRETGDKIMRLAQRAQNQPLFFGDFLNPFARLSVLAVESAAAADSCPVRILGSPVSDGAGALNVLAKAGLGGTTRLAPVLAECLWAYMIRPIQLRLEGVGA